jgi:hypothetical protein
MLLSRIRAVLFGLLAVMLVGSIMAATASAEAGPFWHHRAIGGKGEGAKIEPNAPENFRGTGGKQTLISKVGTTEIEIASNISQVKGAIFNNALQGQAKIEIVYNQPTLIRPALKGCNVRVGLANIVVAKGHLMWKWNGTTEQLNEQPQKAQRPVLVFAGTEPPVQKPEPKEPINLTTATAGIFTTVTFSPAANCGALAGTFNVFGSEEVNFKGQLEEFTRTLDLNTTEGSTIPFGTESIEHAFRQHYWNGTAFLGTIVGLGLGASPAALIGQTKVESEQQEIAVFEK